MSDRSPLILWFRRDLRLGDHPALAEACKADRPVIPVFILDEVEGARRAAPLWRLGLSVEAHGRALADRGSRLILRRGEALPTLRALAREIGAGAVWWTRHYEPQSIARDEAVKAGLRDDGVEAKSFPGHVLFEPWTVETKTGGPYKVYTPFWRAVRGRDPGSPYPAPGTIPAPSDWPKSDDLADWRLAAPMNRGAGIVAPHLVVGESAASHRLGDFAAHRIADYADARNDLADQGTSGLSENLTYGEISIRTVWHSGQRAREEGKAGAETFLKELVWRDFAYHLCFHTPRLTSANWREEWDAFPWKDDEGASEIHAWKRGRTGIEVVDAAMRELFVTGRMHNRARMIVASFLTKHLMTHWKVGLNWFEECLVDWDPANNALGWQWSAGSGPDATPFFRVFNPDTQAEKFDLKGEYRKRWLAELSEDPPDTALAYFDAIPRAWKMAPDDAYPEPVVGLDEGRRRALDAYEGRSF
ncbi:cryptochrome/photolyase family protein [Wenxinia marina]|uniref:Deoxyribodipyrimidine photo-lyase type I n=1 Tax=Wenxinia marina DSM 24838 TaxID=1123501 RepID=A0A0D0NMK6_9RHOB|nr:deoxyribodipyrimidine photo-lyase [Wenxinia marina]KIQ69540.1 deoxyribodipyrimidine photo-lyase type I [Wenxinia marina DSM 24838]GGL59175.1 deoxyribodipyrimidine photo-lyase [Wenxinia marina]